MYAGCMHVCMYALTREHDVTVLLSLHGTFLPPHDRAGRGSERFRRLWRGRSPQHVGRQPHDRLGARAEEGAALPRAGRDRRTGSARAERRVAGSSAPLAARRSLTLAYVRLAEGTMNGAPSVDAEHHLTTFRL